MMTTAYIALGSNLGDRLGYLRSAVASLAAHPNINVVAHSRIYETAPVGGPAGQGAYLNAVVGVSTSLGAHALLAVLQAIETANGRTRTVTWGPRTLDLDLLLFGDEIIAEPDLTVPHPRLAERNFVLAPLCDLIPAFLLPGSMKTVQSLRQQACEEGLRLTELNLSL
ncbi:MAG: 2-amino-4-hydroxy-6-hydroxymethyldihydropteridine diphosphokinase [Blastocatellia bacterium]